MGLSRPASLLSAGSGCEMPGTEEAHDSSDDRAVTGDGDASSLLPKSQFAQPNGAHTEGLGGGGE